jgi:hypothetical protein
MGACLCVSARFSVGVGARARVCACTRVVLLIKQATRRHIAIFSLFASTIIFDIVSQTARFSKKNVIQHKMCIFISSIPFI